MIRDDRFELLLFMSLFFVFVFVYCENIAKTYVTPLTRYIMVTILINTAGSECQISKKVTRD